MILFDCVVKVAMLDQKVKMQCSAHQCYLPPFCIQDVKRVSHSNTLYVPLCHSKQTEGQDK